MGIYGFWYDGHDGWLIGYDSKKGQSIGFAYNHKDVFCPHQLYAWNWLIFNGDYWAWDADGSDLGITCECIITSVGSNPKITNFELLRTVEVEL